MHSTVQTGLYTQNIFGFDYNFYHPPGSSKPHNPYPPPPINYHPHKHSSTSSSHNHHHCEINEQKSECSKFNSADDMRTTPRSNRKIEAGEHDTACKNPLCNSVNILNSTNNINNNQTFLTTLRRKYKYFCQCKKPCGMLSVILGFLLLSGSICGLLFLHVDSICEKAFTCYNATLKILSVTFLVISIFIIFFGFIIIIYSKRDRNAQIIITSTKHMDNLGLSSSKLQISASQVNLAPKKHVTSSKNLPQTFNRSSSYLTIATPAVNQPLFKSTSLMALNKTKYLSTNGLDIEK